jgi:hypothetical protein
MKATGTKHSVLFATGVVTARFGTTDPFRLKNLPFNPTQIATLKSGAKEPFADPLLRRLCPITHSQPLVFRQDREFLGSTREKEFMISSFPEEKKSQTATLKVFREQPSREEMSTDQSLRSSIDLFGLRPIRGNPAPLLDCLGR